MRRASSAILNASENFPLSARPQAIKLRANEEGRTKIPKRSPTRLPPRWVAFQPKYSRASTYSPPGMMRQSQMQICKDSQRQVRRLLRNGEGLFACLDRFFVLTEHPELFGQIGLNPSHPLIVANLISQLPGFAQIGCDTFPIAQWLKNVADIEANVDCFLERIEALRQLRQLFQGLFEKYHRFGIGLPIRSLRSRLTQIHDGFFRKLAAQRMIRQTLHLLANAAGILDFYRLHDSLMYFAPPITAQAGICDIVSERVFEGKLKIGVKLRCVEKFGRLQIVENTADCAIVQTGDFVQQR